MKNVGYKVAIITLASALVAVLFLPLINSTVGDPNGIGELTKEKVSFFNFLSKYN